jgi:hypothetical protein
MKERDSEQFKVGVLANLDGPAEAANTVATPLVKRPTWVQAEGNPSPLGVKWIEEEQAFRLRGSFRTCGERYSIAITLCRRRSGETRPDISLRFSAQQIRPDLALADPRLQRRPGGCGTRRLARGGDRLQCRPRSAFPLAHRCGRSPSCSIAGSGKSYTHIGPERLRGQASC